MAVIERDPHTGYTTTGHEWNGIKELNRPVPRIVLYFLAATVIFAVACWVLLPAWPLGMTYTRGLLGIDQRTTVAQKLAAAAEKKAEWLRRLETSDFAAIQADDDLMDIARQSGQTLFADNCSVCHGSNGKGGPGFPSLAGGSWLWGGDPETIVETMRVGVNSGHPETRVSEMPAFGRDGLLDRQAILDVVDYVQSLSGAVPAGDGDSDAIAAGKEVFAETCAACHGEDGRGDSGTGAPDLTDPFWIYGGDQQSIYTTLYRGRRGHMPHWENRLNPLERKILALYVRDLRSGGK